VWKLFWSESAKKDLSKIDKHVAKLIVLKTTAVLDNCQNPSLYVVPLKYAKSGLYKYRVGSYRIICLLENSKCIIEVVTIGHRKDIYK
jgi:mRNA interferase RelE/StbE